jgi:ketosteroid isomerase-like protein
MSPRKAVVDRYFDGFRESDHVQILECLTDDVVWDLPGFKHLEGKHAFDSEIENAGFVGSPTLDVDRMVEEGDTVVAIGTGSGTQTTGDVFEFAFCTVLTFSAELIERVESYIVPLTTPGA